MKECALFVSCEPCIMCAYALSLINIKEVYFNIMNGEYNNITRTNGARETIQSIPIEQIEDFIHKKETIDYVIEMVDSKYGSGSGIRRLTKLVENGDYNLITRTGNARQLISEFSINEIMEYINMFL